MKCIIREVSRTGCRIVTNALDDLPEIIHLLPEGFDKVIAGRIVWRDKHMAGVEFLTNSQDEGLLIDPIGSKASGEHSSIIDKASIRQKEPRRGFADRFKTFFAPKRKAAPQRRPEARQETEKKNPVSDALSMVVHEFRTPLTSLLGSLSLIRHGLGKALPANATALFDVAQRNAEKLKSMVNDLLDLGKAEAGKMQLDLAKTEIVGLAKTAIENNKPYAAEHGVWFRLDDRLGEAHVHADAQRLEQVLTNFLSNAAKFSPEGRAVDVIVERHEGRIRVSVRDHGPGIPAEQQGKVFEKFVQVEDSSGRNKQGTGLGLSVSKSIIEQHDGRIGVESEVGKGSVFYFELPEAAQQSAAVPSRASA
ncbi:MAG: ATP-binding protein [Hyphomicrobiaceae bacterium]|nr:ATP-binding protein [Hyphomicrobiaceae bacterium]